MPLSPTLREIKESAQTKPTYNYAEWAKSSFSELISEPREEEKYTHTIEYNEVTRLELVFQIDSLFRTAITEAESTEDSEPGELLSDAVDFAVECGYETNLDVNSSLYETLKEESFVLYMQVLGLVRGGGYRKSVSVTLPPAVDGVKRYIKIYRIDAETFSTLRGKEIGLAIINEIIEEKFTYPLSAIAATKIDSMAFSAIPTRTFDGRWKKCLVPSNYFPLEADGTDKRKIKDVNDYSSANPPQIYVDDWDGTFKYAWTDNPAWILYDLVSNPICAIGNYLQSFFDINIFTLYEIGRYCDAVNDSGEFVGVSNGRGGLEPRFSCNIYISNEREAFDVINGIAAIFRGAAYYANDAIQFIDDRQKEIMAIFNNGNVENGAFNYSDTLKSSRYTYIEVPYLDEDDNFLQKVEYVEDEEQIKKYGYIKQTFEGMGITSRSQAQRLGRYALFSNKIETEKVNFTAGREALYLQPGDIIKIDDELKNLWNSNYGYIVDVDTTAKTLVINETDTSQFDINAGIYVYAPTGTNTVKSLFQNVYESNLKVTLEDISGLSPSQVANFSITGTGLVSYSYGSGAKLYLNTGQANINKLNNVVVGTTYNMSLLNRNNHLYRVIGLREQGEGKYDVAAVQHEPQKFALIESGIRFDNEEQYVGSITIDYNYSKPEAPILTRGTAIQNGAVTVTGSVVETGTPSPEEFIIQLVTPAGEIRQKVVENSTGGATAVFSGIKEFGLYTISARSVGAAPAELKSKSCTPQNFIVDYASSAVSSSIDIIEVVVDRATGSYNTDSNTGYFNIIDKDIRIKWTLRDRMDQILVDAHDYEASEDKPIISCDILSGDYSTVMFRDFRKNMSDANLLIKSTDIESIFNDSYPRQLGLQIRVSGQAASIDPKTGVLQLVNEPPTIYDFAVQDTFEGLSDHLIFAANIDPQSKQSITKIEIYTGDSPTFTTISDDNKLSKDENVPKRFLARKDLQIISSKEMPKVVGNQLISFESHVNNMFYADEPIIVGHQDYNNVPSGMTYGDTYYFRSAMHAESILFFQGNYNRLQSLTLSTEYDGFQKDFHALVATNSTENGWMTGALPYTSDFSTADGWAAQYGTGVPDSETGGKTAVMKYFADANNQTHYLYRTFPQYGTGTYNIKLNIYIPSSQTTLSKVAFRRLDAAGNIQPIGASAVSTKDQWVAVDATTTSDRAGDFTLRFYGLTAGSVFNWVGQNDADDDRFFVDDIIITQTTPKSEININNDPASIGKSPNNKYSLNKTIEFDGTGALKVASSIYNSENFEILTAARASNIVTLTLDSSDSTIYTGQIIRVYNLEDYGTDDPNGTWQAQTISGSSPVYVTYNNTGINDTFGIGDNEAYISIRNPLKERAQNIVAGAWLYPQSGHHNDVQAVFDFGMNSGTTAFSGGWFLGLSGSGDGDRKIVVGAISTTGGDHRSKKIILTTGTEDWNYDTWNHIALSIYPAERTGTTGDLSGALGFDIYKDGNLIEQEYDYMATGTGLLGLVTVGTQESGIRIHGGRNPSEYIIGATLHSNVISGTTNLPAGQLRCQFKGHMDDVFIYHGLDTSGSFYDNRYKNEEHPRIIAIKDGFYKENIFYLADSGSELVGISGNYPDINWYMQSRDEYNIYSELTKSNSLLTSTALLKQKFDGLLTGAPIQFAVAIDSPTGNEASVVGAYMLRKGTYNGTNIIWERVPRLETQNINITYLEPSGDFTNGRFVMFTGDFSSPINDSNILYYSTGTDTRPIEINNKYLPPMDILWELGEASGTISLGTGILRLPKLYQSMNKDSIGYTEYSPKLYARMVVSDIFGTGSVFPPLEFSARQFVFSSDSRLETEALASQAISNTNLAFAGITAIGEGDYITQEEIDESTEPVNPVVPVTITASYTYTTVTLTNRLALDMDYYFERIYLNKTSTTTVKTVADSTPTSILADFDGDKTMEIILYARLSNQTPQDSYKFITRIENPYFKGVDSNL